MTGEENENTLHDSYDSASSDNGDSVVSSPVQSEEPQAPILVVNDEPAQAPMQVISVDELVDRLTVAAPESVPGEDGENPETLTETEEGEEEPPVFVPTDFYTSVANNLYGFKTETARYLTEIKTTLSHDINTPFESYTTIEILLTLLVLLKVVELCGKMIRRGFSWLLP